MNKENVLKSSKEASHWRLNKINDTVECKLCPRHCRLKDGQIGVCGVRGNTGRSMTSFNYGMGLPASVESVESEAVYHYRPGAKILCLGNVGCMLDCCFCQNWQTSQMKYLDVNKTCNHTPQSVVDLAVANGIDTLSWTYNDPVVWHEFVLETAHLAADNGLTNIYKSSFYIEKEPLEELMDVIDVFSVSLKSMSPDFYRRHTKGRLEPVLEAIGTIGKGKGHIEVSQLIVTDLNDTAADAVKTATWIGKTLGTDVPLHFVSFHPAYKYTTASRTSRQTLFQAKTAAKQIGMKYVYIGNVYDRGVSDTYCSVCNSPLVERFGMNVSVSGLDANGNCIQCGQPSLIIDPLHSSGKMKRLPDFSLGSEYLHKWSEEVNGIHISGNENEETRIRIQRLPCNQIEDYVLGSGLGRITVNKRELNEDGVRILVNSSKKISILPLLDRAHYPIE